MRYIAMKLTNILLMGLIFFSAAGVWAAEEKEVDKETGLIISEGWELVEANCTGCHSAQLVTGQRGDRQTWTDIIRWMQETQGLWKFDPAVENSILDYLAENYGAGGVFRRTPLPEWALPVNPYGG